MTDPVKQTGYIRTIKNRCRVCFTCVRTCPAEAIRISRNQAEIIQERCISCGNCVRVCSQGAKEIVSTTQEVLTLLEGGGPVAACVAPSAAAEFLEWDYRVLVGMIRKLGFSLVAEVAFGADLVAERYRRLTAEQPGKGYLGTTCPGVVGYVERYHPELLQQLSPIVSPMVATARVLHRLHSPTLPIVFIGPCVAKKAEADSFRAPDGNDEVAVVITFRELRELFDQKKIDPESCQPSDFDPPHAGAGALFPLTRGLLQAAQLQEDLTNCDIVAADGMINFTSALANAASGHLETDLLELLCCKGCIAGPGMTTDETWFLRRKRVSHYVRFRLATLDRKAWKKSVDEMAGLDLSRHFVSRDQRMQDVPEEKLNATLVRMGKETHEDELNCGACGYRTCREHAIAMIRGLAESEMCLPFVIEKFQHSMQELSLSNAELSSAREQLLHSERLATMGQLAAGVAHELNNPLGVVLMYTHLLLDETPKHDEKHQDLSLIAAQADRCKRIVADLLDFARENKALLQRVNVRSLVQRTIEGVTIPEGIQLLVNHRHTSETCDADPDQIVQVLTNLVSNAVAAMPDGGTLEIVTDEVDDRLVLSVRDSGTGIPEENRSKLFQPFFTTKGVKGTGLGLAVSYGIVKMHRGDIQVTSNADPSAGPTGTTFDVRLHLTRETSNHIGDGHG